MALAESSQQLDHHEKKYISYLKVPLFISVHDIIAKPHEIVVSKKKIIRDLFCFIFLQLFFPIFRGRENVWV